MQARRSPAFVTGRTALVVALLVASSGCHILAGGAALGAIGGAVATRDVRVKPDASVRVDFAEPRDVDAVHRASAARDTVRLVRTRQLLGRVERLAGDSVWVVVSEARGETGPTRFRLGASPVVLVRQGPGVRVEPLANRPTWIVAGGLIGTGLGVLYIIIACMLEPCLS
jgi:hypothetical protein